MTFDDYIENEKLISRLKDSIRSGRVGHAYIFEAGGNVDKLAFARCFVKAILCQSGGCNSCAVCRRVEEDGHEDVHLLKPDGASIKDEQLQPLQEQLRRKPFGERNIAIICSADKMTVRVQNRLLKTLEEPAPGTVIILLAENVENLLPTIRSRCMTYRLEDANDADGKAEKLAQKLETMLYEQEDFHLLKAEAEKLAKDIEMTGRVLDAMEKLYAGYLLSGDMRYSSQKVHDAVAAIEEARGKILKNMNAGYAIKAMLIKIGG